MRDNWQRHHDRRLRRRGGDKTTFGIIVIGIGLILLLKTFHIFPFISFHHLWALVLLVVGIAIGIKNRFMNPGSWVLIMIGAFNIIPEFTIMGQSSEKLVWPIIMIATGLFIVLRSRKKKILYAKTEHGHDNQS